MFSLTQFLFHGPVTAAAPDYVLGKCLQDCRVVFIWFLMTGAGTASDTVKVTDGTNDICTAVDVSAKADKALFLPADIDDARRDIAAGTELHAVGAGGATCDVFVLAIPQNTA